MGRYTRTTILKNKTGKQFYQRIVYPNIPRSNQDLYVFTTDEDRYDLLAFQYYKDASLWWVISTANPQYSGASLFPGGGLQIRIPFPIQNVINDFNAVNG
jgi:hypothetical protein|tara:strand:+ start:322 stop:621 length:300 start_codon:yes stop_codon:yes gene_type:complete